MKQLLAIDVGSVSISVVRMDMDGQVLKCSYVMHRGNPALVLQDLLEGLEGEELAGVAAPSGKVSYAAHVRVFDQQLCLMEAARRLVPDFRSVLHVGAERFFLLEVDGEGKYSRTRHSSSCAAGTGSFLDQQASRLGLEDTAHLSELAKANRGVVPDIAARCSVFAKTDLIHAQQRGFGLEAICDSLCKGLAENLAATLFNSGGSQGPMLMSGGVAHNEAVRRHLEVIIGQDIRVHPDAQYFPALGAAYSLLQTIGDAEKPAEAVSLDQLLGKNKPGYHYAALDVGPEQENSHSGRGEFNPLQSGHQARVQVDHYLDPAGESALYLGIDIGSTSTKAVLINSLGEAVSGYYTYTSGKALKASQAILEAIYHDFSRNGGLPEILGCSTTGSGRKFIGSIIGADQDLDEITAHARAAYELDPETDTIIEIGGQDAKFTQMHSGVVTFSHMNTVCAAGTGSFIEELAGRLGVGLEDFDKLVRGRRAPLASDRCTVFMERDINHLLSQGYAVEEVLATVIHSVRENYLKKVASEAHIGEHICFQGATARNRALVAAFEQKLGKKIHVSQLCHLTGALGAALVLKEEFSGKSRFRGLELFRRDIPVENQTCEICLNRCTISIASLNGTKEAYGFLCGRDYETKKHVKKEGGLEDIISIRRRIGKEFKGDSPVRHKEAEVGIPATLHLVEDMDFWTFFFEELGISLRSSASFRQSLKRGKGLAGAEFCAPLDSMYGHVDYLAESCRNIFMPVYLEARVTAEGSEENLCYYTQYSSSLAFTNEHIRNKLHSPMLNFKLGEAHNARILKRSLVDMGYGHITQPMLVRALGLARQKAEAIQEKLQGYFQDDFSASHDDVSVVFLGRPYILRSDNLNKNIPGLFAGMGIRAYTQDMLQTSDSDPALQALLEKIPWHFAAHILRAAEQICRTPGLYPVFITAFKCAPDSFIIAYFEQLMNLFAKPYLIIQIDEHDSNTGYETRAEAALRSFRNHAGRMKAGAAPDLSGLLPRVEHKIGERILLLPNWDADVSPLITANLRRAGYDARLLEPDAMGIRRSMEHNKGQCLPINIIAQGYMDYIRKYDLEPSKCILWMMESHLTCNLRQYPFYIKHILEQAGEGFERAAVYSGELTHRELSLSITYYAYFAYMLGGLFRKLACRIRPYEQHKGDTDRVYDRVKNLLREALSGNSSIDRAVKEGLQLFSGVEYDEGRRKPLVAIFGDFYVRDNDTMNQDLLRDIEAAGGEALITPYHEYTQLNIENIFRRAKLRGEHVSTGFNRIVLNILKFIDDRYYRQFEPFLGPAPGINAGRLEKQLKAFNVDLLHSGESYDNLLKIFYIVENHPDVALFVQTNPSFCCPALVTEAMNTRIREHTGVPVVTLTYDGTSARQNDAIVPYIAHG